MSALCFQVSLEQRVAGVDQNQPSGARPGQPGAAVPTWFLLGSHFRQRHRHAVVVFGETGLGELQLQLRQHVDGLQNRVGVFPDPACHLQQDAVDLGQFVIQQPHQFVVLFDRLQRLDKYGLPAGTGAVDDALHPALLLDFDRDNEAFAADRDQFILHRAAFRQPSQIAAQRFLDGSSSAVRSLAGSGPVPARPDLRACRRAGSCCESPQKLGEVA